jgi:hypothetical protein
MTFLTILGNVLSPALLDEFTDSVFTALQTVNKKARMMYQPQYSGYYPQSPMQPPMQQPYYYQQYAQYLQSDPHQHQTFTAMLNSPMKTVTHQPVHSAPAHQPSPTTSKRFRTSGRPPRSLSAALGTPPL